jgi:hypothetical protein
MMPGSASKSVAWWTHVESSHARITCAGKRASIGDRSSSLIEKASDTGRAAMSGTRSGVSVTVALSPTTTSAPATASTSERLDVRTANWPRELVPLGMQHAFVVDHEGLRTVDVQRTQQFDAGNADATRPGNYDLCIVERGARNL